jgi:hypothetical protein
VFCHLTKVTRVITKIYKVAHPPQGSASQPSSIGSQNPKPMLNLRPELTTQPSHPASHGNYLLMLVNQAKMSNTAGSNVQPPGIDFLMLSSNWSIACYSTKFKRPQRFTLTKQGVIPTSSSTSGIENLIKLFKINLLVNPNLKVMRLPDLSTFVMLSLIWIKLKCSLVDNPKFIIGFWRL